MNSILSKTITGNKSDNKQFGQQCNYFFLLVSIPALIVLLPELLPHFSSEDITVHSIQTKDIETNFYIYEM